MDNHTTCERSDDICPARDVTITNRRDFVRSAGCFAMAIAVLGLGIRDADALPVSMVDGTGSGAERRYPMPAADGVTIDRSAQVIVARAQGYVYAFALSCPHQNNAVKWVAKEGRFQCTKHDSQYKPDGVYTSGHSTRNLDRYAVRRETDTLVVDLHHWVQSDKDPKGWAAATVPA